MLFSKPTDLSVALLLDGNLTPPHSVNGRHFLAPHSRAWSALAPAPAAGGAVTVAVNKPRRHIHSFLCNRDYLLLDLILLVFDIVVALRGHGKTKNRRTNRRRGLVVEPLFTDTPKIRQKSR